MTANIKPPLQLEATFFEDVHISSSSNFDDEQPQTEKLRFELDLGMHPENELICKVDLRVYTANDDGENQQYEIDVKASAVVSLDESIAEKGEEVLRFSIGPIVYSSIREMVQIVTSRCGFGGYMLPAVNPKIAFGRSEDQE